MSCGKLLRQLVVNAMSAGGQSMYTIMEGTWTCYLHWLTFAYKHLWYSLWLHPLRHTQAHQSLLGKQVRLIQAIKLSPCIVH